MTPAIRIAAIALLVQSACSTTNSDYCETDAHCAAGSVCDRAQNACVAAADAGLAEDVADAADPAAACEEDRACVAAAPDSWTGPVAVAEAGRDESLPACGGAFPTAVFEGSFEIVAVGECECECGTASGLFCDGARLHQWTQDEASCEQGVCPIIGGTCTENSQSVGTNSCSPINDVMKDGGFLQAQFGQLQGGSCGAATASSNLEQPYFARDVRVCAAAVDEQAACPDGSACVAAPPAGFEASLCIVKQGVHECSADGPYSERRIRYAGLEDSRSCSADSCECTAPTGSCGGEIRLTDGGEFEGCTTVRATLKPGFGPVGNGANLCQSLPSDAEMVTYQVDLDNKSCRVGGAASIEGDVTGTGAVTLCCMP